MSNTGTDKATNELNDVIEKQTKSQELPDGVKQVPIEDLSEQDQEEIKKFEEEQRVKGIGDMINFTELFRLKGHSLVWTPISQVHRSGMITFAEWLNPTNKKTIQQDEIIRLSDYWFATKTMEAILDEKGEEQFDKKGDRIERIKRLHISAVFNNLNAHFIDVDVDDSKHVEELMSVMVPNYDENEFKPYHVKKVILWYNEIKNKIIAAEKLAEIKKQEEEQNAD